MKYLKLKFGAHEYETDDDTLWIESKSGKMDTKVMWRLCFTPSMTTLRFVNNFEFLSSTPPHAVLLDPDTGKIFAVSIGKERI